MTFLDKLRTIAETHTRQKDFAAAIGIASSDYDALMRDLAAALADLLRENHGVDVRSVDHDPHADSLGSWEHAVAAMRVRRVVEAALAPSDDAYDPATCVTQALVREIPGLLDLVAGRR